MMNDNISNLNLSVKTYNVLKRNGITTVHEIREHIDNGTLHIFRGMGKKSFEEVLIKVTEFEDERTHS